MSEELVIRHCSPTLAGLKTGSLFNCSYRTERELTEGVRQLNRRLVPSGLRVVPVRRQAGKALIYVYRPPGCGRIWRSRTPGGCWRRGDTPATSRSVASPV